jgi:hypothetical protein
MKITQVESFIVQAPTLRFVADSFNRRSPGASRGVIIRTEDGLEGTGYTSTLSHGVLVRRPPGRPQRHHPHGTRRGRHRPLGPQGQGARAASLQIPQDLQVLAGRRRGQTGHLGELRRRPLVVAGEHEHRAPARMTHRPDGVVERGGRAGTDGGPSRQAAGPAATRRPGRRPRGRPTRMCGPVPASPAGTRLDRSRITLCPKATARRPSRQAACSVQDGGHRVVMSSDAQAVSLARPRPRPRRRDRAFSIH